MGICMSNLIAAVIGALVGCGGTFIATYFILLKQRKLEAAAKFREAFIDEIALCKSSQKVEIKAVSFDALIKHEKAVIMYEPFLRKREVSSFKTVWKKYCENHSYRNMNDWVPEGGVNNDNVFSAMSEIEQRKNTLAFYQKIFSYAPIK